MVKTIYALILALPEILKLINNLQKKIEEQKIDSKVKEDLKKINEAFEKKDTKLLNDIFNSNIK